MRHLRIFLQLRLGGALVEAGLAHAVEMQQSLRRRSIEKSGYRRRSSAFAAAASVC